MTLIEKFEQLALRVTRLEDAMRRSQEVWREMGNPIKEPYFILGMMVYPCPVCGTEYRSEDDVCKHLDEDGCVGDSELDVAAELAYEYWKNERS